MHLNRIKQPGLLLLLAIVLQMAGCQLLPTTTKTTKPLQSQALAQWELRGKIGVLAQGEAYSAYFNWQQQSAAYHLQISGPLGHGAIHLDGSHEESAVLRQSGHPPQHGASPEALLKESTQWDLPVSELFWWIRGLAAPDRRSVSRTNTDGTLQQLQQSGWVIDYDRYGSYQGYALPEKIRLRRPDLRLTILIKQWSTLQSDHAQSD